MKQVLQNLSSGTTYVSDIPVPQNGSKNIQIRSAVSLISSGTERMLVDFGKANILEKAKQQPDKVLMVLEKLRTDGILPTIESVRAKLQQPLPMGYSNVGVVVDLGSEVSGFEVGDRVVSNGPHAEFVSVPPRLCAKIPDHVNNETAVYTVIAAIALQGIRLAEPTIGESFVVTGLGLVGLLAVQILRAQGCRVLGIDPDPAKLLKAQQFGAETVDLAQGEDPIARAETFSRGQGVDGVIIAASTKSNNPVHQAAMMCRKRGRIVLIGVVGMQLSRADFYEKELTFQVSCSYGPGRYDPEYEQRGHDYPLGFVRWTEQRNFEAVLDMMASGAIQTDDLTDNSFEIEKAPLAYRWLIENRSSLGIFLEYPKAKKSQDFSPQRVVYLSPPAENRKIAGVAPSVAFIGAGNYAGKILIPAFRRAGATMSTIVSASGVSGAHLGKKFGFERVSTDIDIVLSDPAIDAVVIATPHNSHARLAQRALEAGKAVFIEKPLALTREELGEVETAWKRASEKGMAPQICVGFNRRFAPLVQKLASQISRSVEPVTIIYTVNAGAVPGDHWIQDQKVGGGRIIGEVCHFIDLARHLAGSPIKSVSTNSMRKPRGVPDYNDTLSISLRFECGSAAEIHYFANGSRSFPKERIEVFQAGKVFVVDNFRAFREFGMPSVHLRSMRQDKGQAALVKAFIGSLKNSESSPIPFDEILEVSDRTIEAAELAREN